MRVSRSIVSIRKDLIRDLTQAIDIPRILLCFKSVKRHIELCLRWEIPRPICESRKLFRVFVASDESSNAFLELSCDCDVSHRDGNIVLEELILKKLDN